MGEQSLILGAENHLVATMTPAENGGNSAPRYVAVLTNSGVIPRGGPHRMNVHLARRFAKMGIPSIRFDMSGLGDSARSSRTQPVVEQWVADTRAVMDAAQRQFACNRFFMVGFCSGAEVAHLVALEDRRMRAAVLWDLYAYPTLQSMVRTALYRLRRAGVRGSLHKVVMRTKSLFQGQADQAQDSAVEVSQVPPRDEFAKRIQTLVDAEVELLFAFCSGQNEWFNHRGQFRQMFAGYPFVKKVAFEHLDISDHVITRPEAQSAFTNMVVEWLEQRVLVASRPAASAR
jgi:pimeloyl-ACP methyl ester carboxylesterase